MIPLPILSVVVPLFNEQGIVEELVRRIRQSCRLLDDSFEMILVNDGSSDGTLPRLIEIGRNVPELRVVNLYRNFGHMPALTAGISLAKGKAVVVLDGDLQDPPEVIPELFAQWKAGADVVYGLRTARKDPFLTRLGTSLFYWLLQKTAETKIPSQAGTFCLMDRRVADLLNRMPERVRYFAGLRAWVGGRQTYVTYERPSRSHGKSKVGKRGLFRLARAGLISFSKVPLRYASLLSLCCGFVLFLVGITAVLIRLATRLAVPGWATYTTLIGVMGFVQSIVLAVIAEYVAVIFDEVKARPQFLVREEFVGGERVKAVEPVEYFAGKSA